MRGLRDSSGQIVINEREAASDIRKIEAAAEKFRAALKLLDPAKLDDESFLGTTRGELDQLLVRIIRDINNKITQCEKTAGYIKYVVEKYQQSDRECAASMGGNR